MPLPLTRLFVATAATALLLTGCTVSIEPDAAADEVDLVAIGDGLSAPSGLAFRPGTDELWITNRGSDSITVINTADTSDRATLRDAYAEHFTAMPSGLAFSADGAYFAVANDSNNEVRGMTFTLNPERNDHFAGNNFMGPSLFSTSTFAVAGQTKEYLDDWPQPGIAHDNPDDTPESDCPAEYWSEATSKCDWPRQGSHIDMLHGDPLSTGILHAKANSYYVLDGCGAHDDTDTCIGPGHVTLVDFNRDHQEGNGFHGDGTTTRYIDLPYTRVDGLPSGMFERDGWIYYADTGAGTVRRFQPDTGTTQVMVSNWNGTEAGRHEHGSGVTDWSHLENSPGDGDDPDTIGAWVAEFGDHDAIAAAGDDWIAPMETLAEYSYVRGATHEDAAQASRPTGIAAGVDSWFVADNATGVITEYDFSGAVLRTISTNAGSLTGLALSPDGAWLYLADAADDSIGRIFLG